MFSLQQHFEKVQFNFNTSNIIFATKAQDADEFCPNGKQDKVFLEAFQDNTAMEASQAGAVFCDTLNGKMIGFPETMTELSDLKDYASELLTLANLDELAIPLNAISHSDVSKRPEMRSPKKYLDIYAKGSDIQIKPETEVFNLMHKGRNSYQSRQELCYILTTRKTKGGGDEDQIEEEQKSSISADLCNGLGNWWTICMFEAKLSVKLSGLCALSSVDRHFAVVAPVKGSPDRYGTFVGITG